MPKRTDRTHTPSGQALNEHPEGRDEALEAIGQGIRQARLAAGLTGPQLASRVGCSTSWIYSLEGGLQNFTYATFRRVCDVLGVDFRQVMIGGDEIHARQAHARLVALADSTALKLVAAGQILAELRSYSDESQALLQLDDPPAGPAGRAIKKLS